VISTSATRIACALVGAFGGDAVRFHDPSGGGYAFLADGVLELDGKNPQVASRLVSAFNDWRRYDEARQERMQAELQRIAGHEGLSRRLRDRSRCRQGRADRASGGAAVERNAAG
jgi:aminopeptidase N